MRPRWPVVLLSEDMSCLVPSAGLGGGSPIPPRSGSLSAFVVMVYYERIHAHYLNGVLEFQKKCLNFIIRSTFDGSIYP